MVGPVGPVGLFGRPNPVGFGHLCLADLASPVAELGGRLRVLRSARRDSANG